MRTVTILTVVNNKVVDTMRTELTLTQIRELEKSNDFVVIEK